MNRAEIVKAIATKLECSHKDASNAVDAVFEVFDENLCKEGDSINITKVGTLKAVQRKARQGRNPRTGAIIQIPEKVTLKFTPSKYKHSM